MHGIKIRCLTNLAIPQGALQPGRAAERTGFDMGREEDCPRKPLRLLIQKYLTVLQTAPVISSFPAFASKVRARGDVKFPSSRGCRNRNRLKYRLRGPQGNQLERNQPLNRRHKYTRFYFTRGLHVGTFSCGDTCRQVQKLGSLYGRELRPPPRGSARGVPPPPAPPRVNPFIP